MTAATRTTPGDDGGAGDSRPIPSTAAMDGERRATRRRRPRPWSTRGRDGGVGVGSGRPPPPPPSRRRRRPPSSSPSVALLFFGALLVPSSRAAGSEPRLVGRRDLIAGGTVIRRHSDCRPDQHDLLLTFYTDANSIYDNAWELSYAPLVEAGGDDDDGEEEEGEGPPPPPRTVVDAHVLGDGTLGFGAVVTHAMCADASSPPPSSASGGIGGGGGVETCYDLRVHDLGGDGLTSPHAGHAGLAGGFALQLDGNTVVEHRGRACLEDDEDERNACATESGFETCGVRVCATVEGGATVSALEGSQCEVTASQCAPGSGIQSSSSSIEVKANTDSFGDEFSYEVRRSSRSDPAGSGDGAGHDLLLAGGTPVRAVADGEIGTIVLGRAGIGVPLGDLEEHHNAACLSDADVARGDACYDLRAYDAYGDGLGCGADGSLSISLAGPSGTYALVQKDEDASRRRKVGGSGKKKKACTDDEGNPIRKWSHCAVRVCGDGTVMGLEGNQCDFGMGDALIDARYVASDPLEMLELARPGEDEEEEGEKFDLVWPGASKPTKPEVHLEEEPIEANEIVVAESWADYYDALEPGFRGPDETPHAASSAADFEGGLLVPPDYVEPVEAKPDRPPEKKPQGFKGPKPDKDEPKPQAANGQVQAGGGKKPGNKPQGFKGPKPDKDEPKPQVANVQAGGGKKPGNKPQGFKGPKPDKDGGGGGGGGLALRPMSANGNNNNNKPSKQKKNQLDLKPFTIELLEVDFPRALKFARPEKASAEVGDHLLSYARNYPFDLARGDPSVILPVQFEVTCDRKKGRRGREVRWVLKCEGSAEFPPSAKGSTLPKRKALNGMVRNAFAGHAKETFLAVMYGGVGVGAAGGGGTGGGGKKDKPKKTKFQQWKEKKEKEKKKKKQMMQQMQRRRKRQKETPDGEGDGEARNLREARGPEAPSTPDAAEGELGSLGRRSLEIEIAEIGGHGEGQAASGRRQLDARGGVGRRRMLREVPS